MKKIEEKIRGIDADMRLDRWLKRRFPHLPHAMLAKELRKGNIRLNDVKSTPEARIAAYDTVAFTPFIEQANIRSEEDETRPSGEKKIPPVSVLQAVENAIIHDTHDLLVLNKPSGMAVQGGTGIAHPIDEVLRAIFQRNDILPVHRLDRDTTGVLIFAKNRQKAAQLSEALRMRETKKNYLAVLQGAPSKGEGTWMTFMRKEADDSGTEKMHSYIRPTDRDDKKAITAYKVLDHSVKRYALTRMTPVTGRTHQLRVHAAGAGCPIIGDFKYGYTADINAPKNALLLHAANITLPGGQCFSADAPEVFMAFCDKLGLELE